MVREFGDQREVAAEAQARLAALRQPVAARSGIVTRQVWTGPKVDTGGTVSADGRYLSFTDWSANELGVHDLTTGTDRLATKKDASASPADYPEESAVSRDGKKAAVAWFSISAGRYELKLIDLDAGAPATPRTLFTNKEVSWIAPFDWSSDGAWLAVQLQRKDKTAQIGLVSVTDGALRILKSVEWRGASKLLFSPDGKNLAYDLPAAENTDQRDIFLLATDASKETPLLVHPSDETVLAWTPDGKHLLFESDRSGSRSLWALPLKDGKSEGNPLMMKPDIGNAHGLGLGRSGTLYIGQNVGGQDIQIAVVDFQAGKLLSAPEKPVQEFVGSNRDPSFSPDGKYIAYQSLRGRSSLVLAIRSLETGQVRELRPDLSYFNQPSWSPNGRSIAVRARDKKGRDGLYSIDVQTGAITLLVAGVEAAGTTRPIWSPDGKALYYRRARGIMSRELASGVEREVFQGKAPLAQPHLSPDGRQFAMIGGQARGSLFVVPVEGGELREILKLAKDGYFRSLEWTPDGQAVIASKVGAGGEAGVELWRIPIAGGSPQKIALPVMGDFSIHPDGRRIAFTSGQRQSEVWAIDNFLPILQAKK